MNPQFSQPGGSVSKDVNKQSIARVLGVKMSEVAYLKIGLIVDGYKILYDKETQTCWYRGTATGATASWTVTNKLLNLTTSNGSYVLAMGYSGDTLRQELASTSGASLSGLEQGGTVQDAIKYITPEMFKAVGDGVTDDTVAFQAACDYSSVNQTTLIVPAKTYLLKSLRINDGVHMVGCGRKSVIKKMGSSTDPLVYSKDYLLLDNMATNSGNGTEIKDFEIRNICLDGSWKDKNLQVPVGLLIYGSGYVLENIYIKNVSGHGMVTSGGNINPTFGMESTIRKIRIDTCGQNGWWAAGPHDSVVDDFIVIDSGQAATDTYYGISFETTMNIRGNALHVWSRAESLRNKVAMYDRGWGNDIQNSHFEGANYCQLLITGQVNQYNNCKCYANWDNTVVGGSGNVVIRSPNNRFIGMCSGPGLNKADCYGVRLGDNESSYAANCYINVTVTNTRLGGIDFTYEGGHNTVFLSGFCDNTTEKAYGGSPTIKGSSYFKSTCPEYVYTYEPGTREP